MHTYADQHPVDFTFATAGARDSVEAGPGVAFTSMVRAMSTFRTDVLGILKQKGFVGHSHALEGLIETVDNNRGLALAKVRLYKPFGLILLTLIPILAALLSAFIGVKEEISSLLPAGAEPWEFFFSLALTIFTILNSIYKPSQRFQEACLIGIGIDRFATNFIADLEKTTHVTEESLARFVELKRNQFEKYQVALIELALPLEAAPRKESEEATGPEARPHAGHR